MAIITPLRPRSTEKCRRLAGSADVAARFDQARRPNLLLSLLLTGPRTIPPVLGSGPPSGDIRPLDDYNLALRDQAEQQQLPQSDIERAGRSIEILFIAPVDLRTSFSDMKY